MPGAGVDQEVFRWVYDHRAEPFDSFFIGLSILGYAGAGWILLALLLAFLRGRPPLPLAALAALCVWSADLLALGLKGLADRRRPFEVFDDVESLFGGTLGGSLPSGHAATAFAGAVVLTRAFPRGAPGFFGLAVAIGFSRIYLGVHFPSDVLAGAALGAAVALVILGLLRLRRPSGAAPRRSGAAPPGG